MPHGVREEDVEFTKIESALIGMFQMETVVLGIDSHVSLWWYNIVTNYTSALACDCDMWS